MKASSAFLAVLFFLLLGATSNSVRAQEDPKQSIRIPVQLVVSDHQVSRAIASSLERYFAEADGLFQAGANESQTRLRINIQSVGDGIMEIYCVLLELVPANADWGKVFGHIYVTLKPGSGYLSGQMRELLAGYFGQDDLYYYQILFALWQEPTWRSLEEAHQIAQREVDEGVEKGFIPEPHGNY